MNKKHLSCTTMLVGKGVTADGSTIIARNEDGYAPVGPKAFDVRRASDKSHRTYVSSVTGVRIPLPTHSYRYTCEPSVPTDQPAHEEAGINEKNVAMSATETIYTNQRFLGYDPLVHHGVNEDCMLTVVLPYINNAREGVARLGKLIEKYGTGESNGIAFSDRNEVWYMETAGGHHWAAVRIPDNAYAIAPNQISIQDIDFNNPQYYMWSTDLKDFVNRNHLNLDPKHFNFRNIAGTHTESDAHYNTPRSWYGQKLFSHDDTQQPTSQNIPFIRRPYRKLTVEDVQYFLTSHYQQTPYDPFTNPNEFKKPTFRSIALDRNQISHILQIRNNVAPQYAAIEWVAFGFLCYSPYVPFYANINQVPTNYKNTTNQVSVNNAYWLYKLLAVIVEPHYHNFINEINAYRNDCQTYSIQRLLATDKNAKTLTQQKLSKYLTKASCHTANHITNKTHKLIDQLVKQALNLSPITFEPGDNL